ncbi:MAG TPA: hypothetical protein VKY89_00150 [Thermoanaerobaculia bacterium]|jgi:hypothetical protein|nr:hypothetical protein [Thermoanaerobaculia bacterium]
MSADRDDGELREQYRRLRRQDESLARPFSVPRQAARRQSRTRSRGHLRQLLAAAALGLAVAAGVGALLWLRPRLAEPSAAAIARLSQWRAPTDSLLQTPGSQLMRSVPRLGASPFGGKYLDESDHRKLLRRP